MTEAGRDLRFAKIRELERLLKDRIADRVQLHKEIDAIDDDWEKRMRKHELINNGYDIRTLLDRLDEERKRVVQVYGRLRERKDKDRF
jgi:hypothetical protein